MVAAVDRALPRRATGTKSPRLRIEPFVAEGKRPSWTVRWRVRNDGASTVRVLSAVQPHAQFRARETSLDRAIAPGQAAELALAVRFDEEPGSVVENPFLILRVETSAREFRVLARVRTTAGALGEPVAGRDVIVTAQPVGSRD